MLGFNFSRSDEIVAKVCARLKRERMVKQWTQAELAERSGISTNTVANMEAGRNVSFETVVRVAMTLGRVKEFESLFQPKLNSIYDIEKYEKSARRQRIRKKGTAVGS